MTTDWEKLQSKSIDLLRFPMAVAVVILHYGTTKISYATGLLRGLCIVFEEGICRLAVPCFFLISGYLFFHRLHQWDWSIWTQKIKHRVRTLLIPYILWIVIAFLAYWIYALAKGEETSFFQQFEYCGGFRMFYGRKGGFPISIRDVPLNSPLWFIRDLIYLTLATPLIYFFITRTRIYGILILCLLFLFVPGAIPEGFVFFGVGSYLQIEQKNILEIAWPRRAFLYIASALLLIALYFFITCGFWGRFFKNLFLFTGIGSAFCLAARLLQTGKIRVIPFLVRSSFFIFATHEILILRQIAAPFVFRMLPYSGQFWACLCFFLTPAVAILICLILLFAMEQLLPHTTAVLTGSRNSNHPVHSAL